ncbi:hypothetical protein SNOG_06089 [Parastagonospora nodorum SN15]|uniref:Uncharacterized protein n=1 Tax=Phaeosphaeria nodorum (strain SN15 / ATCC MYA-4574 / FGSC 10173) TaxID=321614 RepID=Q0UQ75_PHANO|nr:hypothetical protein SNOG_06089 [Parastagonospora nodorum SN15]EAT87153.1 hypothetical protein SNOG_06089 [Parastagonospora nodorum SN15]
MPAVAHLTRRLLEGGSSGGISATSIGLIVGLGVVPVIICVWVVSWLFWCYPYDRSCCCTRRKKKQQLDEEINPTGHRTGRSLDSLHEKAAYPMPAGQAPVNYRTESGNPGRLQKTDPRFSVQTANSSNTIHYVQEPKPFQQYTYDYEDKIPNTGVEMVQV